MRANARRPSSGCRVLVAAFAAFTLSACEIETHDDEDFHSEYAGPGEVVVAWAISGSRNPDVCQERDATTISIVVQTSSGNLIGDYRQDCGEFATSIILDPGTYVADAVLLDGTGEERTTAILIDTFYVLGDSRILIPVDFPVNSFY